MSETEYKKFDTGDVRKSIGEIKDVMVDSISKLFERGEKLDTIVDKTDDLQRESVEFKKKSNTLMKKMKYKNIVCIFLIILVIIIIALIIIFVLCGFDMKQCSK